MIQIDNVTVRFRIPHERIPTFQEYAIRWLKRRGVRYADFNALNDISFSVEQGETIGIIGPNGAGKSTLLKVIARVLRPTRGRLRLRGRVAPLLELGAGFDYEMTGRENVFLNGAVLGFSRKDIARRLDRIVDFSGIGDFIDAPVRTYSSGMVARLGFAVATDIRPEVLIIDEVLAVGDAEFQQKSAARIREFRGSGSTILVVSHSPASIKALCDRALWLEHGAIRAIGPADAVVDQYAPGKPVR
ncbi:MAG TPA: ABC transporter ATP-binding protein [Candidatus Competibacter sp.]|nr:ABC transporter ATP-binding protein [Candidatus Competibacter sp.]HUM93595.1 ABC transporter ATP-binding protein [Candidatus Competibacter sp.]